MFSCTIDGQVCPKCENQETKQNQNCSKCSYATFAANVSWRTVENSRAEIFHHVPSIKPWRTVRDIWNGPCEQPLQGLF